MVRYVDTAVDQSTIETVQEVNVMVDVPTRIRLLAQSRDFQPSVRIGKAGLTDTVIEEIRQQLFAREVVKVKVNRGLFDKEDRQLIWAQLADMTNSTLVLQRGNIGVLWRR